MALNRYVVRDKTEAVTPPTVNQITPVEGGVILVWDDATTGANADTVRYTFYIILRRDVAGAAAYTEGWDVQSLDGSAIATGQVINVNENVGAMSTELILLPPRTATAHSNHQAFDMGDIAPDAITDANIMDEVLNSDGSFLSVAVGNRFSPPVARSIFRTDVMNATDGPDIRAVF